MACRQRAQSVAQPPFLITGNCSCEPTLYFSNFEVRWLLRQSKSLDVCHHGCNKAPSLVCISSFFLPSQTRSCRWMLRMQNVPSSRTAEGLHAWGASGLCLNVCLFAPTAPRAWFAFSFRQALEVLAWWSCMPCALPTADSSFCTGILKS